MPTAAHNLSWRKCCETSSYWRFDCRLDYVGRLMYGITHGVSELRDLFSKLIKEGQMTREEALDRLRTEECVSQDVLEHALADIGLKLSDLQLGLDKCALFFGQ